jgi:hypothetical protein
MSRKSLVLTSCGGLSLLVSAALCVNWMLRPPRVTLPDGNTYDFGTLEEDGSLSKMFRIRNSGGRELQIIAVRTSCGCTSAEVDRKTIPGGQTGQLTVSYHARPLHSQERINVVLATNDPRNPFPGFMITGNIRLRVFWSPRAVSFFRDAATTATKPKTVQLSAYDDDLVVERVEVSNRHIAVDQRRTGKGVELVFTLSPACPRGFRTETATLHLRGTTFEKDIKIPVYLMIS